MALKWIWLKDLVVSRNCQLVIPILILLVTLGGWLDLLDCSTVFCDAGTNIFVKVLSVGVLLLKMLLHLLVLLLELLNLEILKLQLLIL